MNSDLINTYRRIKYDDDRVAELLKKLPINSTTYYQLRTWKPDSLVDRAVRFLYLNRTAFAGMYRVNSENEFNVPYGYNGRTLDTLWENKLLRNAATALRHARLRACDFEETLNDAGRKDLVYCDPTYTVMHNNNGFVRYNEANFSWDDQTSASFSLSTSR